MKYPATLIFPCFFAITAHAAEPSFEIFSYTGKDLFPSAIISTATVDWSEFEEAVEEAEEEEGEEAEDEESAEDGEEEEESADDEGAEEEDEAEAEEEVEGETPTLGDINGWLGISLTDVPKGAEIKVEMTGDGWMKPSRFVGKAVDEEGEPISGDMDVMPKGVWDYDALRKVQEQKPVNLTVKVTINGKELPEQNETLVMRSMNDCPFFVIHGEEEEDIEDISWCFAAYVNENHPWIDGLLKEALATAKDSEGEALIDSFSGYQSGDTEEVLKQVFAIWQVLQRRGIKYSDVSTTVPSKTVASQVVRFVDETVDAKQANCVDGSVLMASILTKIGLKAYLVMVPGHCYLAFNGSKKDDSIIGLETTMLGQDNLKSIDELNSIKTKTGDEKMDAKKFKSLVTQEAGASMKTFLNAIDTGNASLQEHAEAFAEATDPNIQLISISEWRGHGIMPLASGKERR
jgi:hypothetical protein